MFTCTHGTHMIDTCQTHFTHVPITSNTILHLHHKLYLYICDASVKLGTNDSVHVFVNNGNSVPYTIYNIIIEALCIYSMKDT